MTIPLRTQPASMSLPPFMQLPSANEQLLAGIVSSAMDGIIMINEQHRIVLFNAAAEMMFRCRAEEVLGRPLTILLPERYRDTHGQKIEEFGRSSMSSRKMGAHTQVWGRRFDGEEFPIEASLSKILADDRRFFTVILRDTTERQRVESALLARKAQIKELADAMPQMVFVINTEGKFEYLNRHARNALGAIPESKWWIIVPEMDRAKLLDQWREALRTGNAFQLMHRIYIESSGGLRWFLSRAVPMQDENGEVQRWYGTATDIHEQKLTADQLEHTSQLLRAVLHGASEGIYAKDLSGRYLLANPAFAQFVGKPVEQIVGAHDQLLFSAEDVQRILTRDPEIIQSQKGQSYESHLITGSKRKTYLGTKSPLIDQEGNVAGLIGIVHDITKRKQAEEEHQENERRLQMALAASQMGVWELNPTTGSYYWSPECYQLLGFDNQDNPLQDIFQALHPDDKVRIQELINRAIENLENYAAECRCVRASGEIRWMMMRGQVVVDQEQQLQRIVGVIQDITDRVHLEEQLRQAQKMEAIGQLAGGIAHDFNNLLTVISGYSNLLLAKLSPEDTNHPYIKNIYEAGERASALTRQLLAFSRKQVLEPKLVDLHLIIENIESMLRRLIGEDIALITLLAAEKRHVKLDPHQFEQVIVNLAVNARDAMPTGGLLTIETRNVFLDDYYCSLHADVNAGHYLRVAVTDTGEGISSEVQKRIFEPFFTTKATGKGTGLGLATVFGIVKQSNGHIKVYSEVGVGTCFKIYLPLAQQDIVTIAQHAPKNEQSGSETILLVEDDESVRTITELALQEHGYHVITSTNANQALEIIQHHHGEITLLLTDVIMPQMNGTSLVQRLKEMQPALKVLYMSGYTDDAIVRHSIINQESAFINKPFSPVALAHKVREVLDGES